MNSARTRQNESKGNHGVYRYIFVIACLVIMLMGWGAFNSYGLFFESLLKEFGWTRALTSAAFAVSIFVSGLASFPSGRLSDKFGPRVVLIFCGILLGLGFILMSQVNAVWQVFAIYAILLGIGVGGQWSPIMSSIARRFITRRGLMSGIVASGIGLGAMVFGPFIGWLIFKLEWRDSYIILGIICIVAIVGAAIFLKRKPDHSGLTTHDERMPHAISRTREGDYSFREALNTKQFWLVVVLYFFLGFDQVMMNVHVVPYAITAGVNPLSAASIFVFIGAFGVVSRILVGLIADRIRTRRSLFISLGSFLISYIILQFANNLGTLYLFGAFFGFAWGGTSTLQSIIGAELFGLKSLGSVVGTFSAAFCFGGTLGPVVAGLMYDKFGGYGQAWLLILVISAVTLLIALLLKPLTEKR